MLNIIFDLDETLINSVHLDNNETILMKTTNRYTEVYLINVGKNNNFLVNCRSYSSLLLKYCFKNFNVGFWTAGTIDYGKKIIKRLLNEEEYKKTICIIGKEKKNDKYWLCKDIINNNKFKIPLLDGQKTKPLSILFEDNTHYKNINKRNTILIDNNTWNIIPNPKNSLYLIDCCTHIKDNILFILYQKLKDIKEKKITNVQTIDFKIFFNDLYGKDSCKVEFDRNTKNKKTKYNVGDCISINNKKLNNQEEVIWIVLEIINNKTNNSKTLKKKDKKKSNKYKYKIISLFKGEVYNDLVNHEDIKYQLLI